MPSREIASPAELQEAAFGIVKACYKASKGFPYHQQVLRWMKEEVSVGEAYTQRAAIYCAANCFLQVMQIFVKQKLLTRLARKFQGVGMYPVCSQGPTWLCCFMEKNIFQGIELEG